MIRSHLQWWMNPNQFVTGTTIHPPDPKFFLYTDASHFGWGAHLEPTTLFFHGRWTEDQSQLHINMLEMMAIRLALKQAVSFIHHSCIMISTDNTTVNGGLIHQQTGWHSFSQPLRRSLGNSQLVPGTRHRYQSSSHSRQIQHSCRPLIKIRQTYQDRMGSGSNSSKFSIPDAQFSKCGLVCDSIQSQTPIICLSSTRLQGTSDTGQQHR